MKVWGFAALAACMAVPGAAQAGDAYFIGEVYATAAYYCPEGTFPADGRLLPVQMHQALGHVLGNRYGGDGKTTFGLPKIAGGAPGHPGTRWCVVADGDFPMNPEH